MPSTKYIEVEGVKYPIRYDMNALSDFEDVTGKSLLGGLSKEESSSIKLLRALAYVGLKAGHYHESKGKEVFPFTLEDVGSWFDMSNPSFMDEYKNSMPHVEKTDGEEQSPGE